MFSKVGVKVFFGYYWIITFFWIFCFAKILRTRKKELKFGQISTKPGQNISRLPFLHHKLHEFLFPCHSLVSSFFWPTDRFQQGVHNYQLSVDRSDIVQWNVKIFWKICTGFWMHSICPPAPFFPFFPFFIQSNKMYDSLKLQII